MEPTAANPAPALVLVQHDSWLAPFEPVLRQRQARLAARLAEIKQHHGSLEAYATAHQQLGLHYDGRRRGFRYREWAPGAEALYLVGDFNGWDRRADPLQRLDYGVWEIFLPDKDYKDRLVHNSKYKVHVLSANGALDRLPATAPPWCRTTPPRTTPPRCGAPPRPSPGRTRSFGWPRPSRSRSSTRPTWAWPPRKAAWACTASLPTIFCPASRPPATTACS